MNVKPISAELRRQALPWQKEEITGYHTYRRLERAVWIDHQAFSVAFHGCLRIPFSQV